MPLPLQEPPTGVLALCFTIEMTPRGRWACQSQVFWGALICINDSTAPGGVPSCALSPDARERWEMPCRSPQRLRVLCSLSPLLGEARQRQVPPHLLDRPRGASPPPASLTHHLPPMQASRGQPLLGDALLPAGCLMEEGATPGTHRDNSMVGERQA